MHTQPSLKADRSLMRQCSYLARTCGCVCARERESRNLRRQSLNCLQVIARSARRLRSTRQLGRARCRAGLRSGRKKKKEKKKAGNKRPTPQMRANTLNPWQTFLHERCTIAAPPSPSYSGKVAPLSLQQRVGYRCGFVRAASTVRKQIEPDHRWVSFGGAMSQHMLDLAGGWLGLSPSDLQLHEWDRLATACVYRHARGHKERANVYKPCTI